MYSQKIAGKPKQSQVPTRAPMRPRRLAKKGMTLARMKAKIQEALMMAYHDALALTDFSWITSGSFLQTMS